MSNEFIPEEVDVLDNNFEPERKLPVLDKVPKGDKMALVMFDGTALTEQGNVVKHNWFNGIAIDSGAYSDLMLTPTEARQLRTAHQRMKTGSSAASVMTCYGPTVCPMARTCQPPGTMVLTREGQIPIEDLDPEKHHIATYRKHGMLALGLTNKSVRSNGYKFTKHKRHFEGYLVQLQAATGERHFCTPDHICEVRWAESALDKYCVYLMQKGDHFRVGRTKLLTKRKRQLIFGPSERARNEDADKVWILGIYSSIAEAHLAEESYSLLWGLPKTLFVSSNKKDRKWDGAYAWVTQDMLNKHHQKLSPTPSEIAWRLRTIQKDYRFPIWSKNNAVDPETNATMGTRFSNIRACNLYSEYMDIPVLRSGIFSPQRLSLSWKKYAGPVYSLDVEKYHTYIANNIATHNCPYVALQEELDRAKEQRRVVPVGRKCPIEQDILVTALKNLAEEYDIPDGEANYTDQRYAFELAEIEVLEHRINSVMAGDPEFQGLTEEKLVSTIITKAGDQQDNYVKDIADTFKLKEKLWARKDKIRKELVGTRREQRLVSAREGEAVLDASQHFAEIAKRLKQLQPNSGD